MDEHEVSVCPRFIGCSAGEEQPLFIAGGKLMKMDHLRDDPALSFMGH